MALDHNLIYYEALLEASLVSAQTFCRLGDSNFDCKFACEMSDLKSQVLKDTNQHRLFKFSGNSKT